MNNTVKRRSHGRRGIQTQEDEEDSLSGTVRGKTISLCSTVRTIWEHEKHEKHCETKKEKEGTFRRKQRIQ